MPDWCVPGDVPERDGGAAVEGLAAERRTVERRQFRVFAVRVTEAELRTLGSGRAGREKPETPPRPFRSPLEEAFIGQLDAEGVEYETEWRFDTVGDLVPHALCGGTGSRGTKRMADRVTSIVCRGCKGVGLVEKFRQWRLDIAIPSGLVGVELHGGIHSGGRHTRGTGFENDREKMNAAILLGWRVLEFTAKHVGDGSAIRDTLRALQAMNAYHVDDTERQQQQETRP